MKSGMIDSKGKNHELPFYEIQGLCKYIVDTAIKKSEKYKTIYESYKEKMHRFSPEFDFCLHELGWMLYDPFMLGREEVLFSNGHHFYVASLANIKKEDFRRESLQDETIGYPALTDQAIKYNKDLITIEGMDSGIIDERGFVSSSCVSSMDVLAQLEIMYECMQSKSYYEDYQAHKEDFETALEFRTSKENVIAIEKQPNGKFTLEYVSKNVGKVLTLIEALVASNSIADLKPLVVGETKPLVIEDDEKENAKSYKAMMATLPPMRILEEENLRFKFVKNYASIYAIFSAALLPLNLINGIIVLGVEATTLASFPARGGLNILRNEALKHKVNRVISRIKRELGINLAINYDYEQRDIDIAIHDHDLNVLWSDLDREALSALLTIEQIDEIDKIIDEELSVNYSGYVKHITLDNIKDAFSIIGGILTNRELMDVSFNPKRTVFNKMEYDHFMQMHSDESLEVFSMHLSNYFAENLLSISKEQKKAILSQFEPKFLEYGEMGRKEYEELYFQIVDKKKNDKGMGIK